MEGSIVLEVFNWLLGHFPDVAAIMVAIAFVVWTTVKVSNFSHRFTSTERLCKDIHNQQLPEIRKELSDVRMEMNEKLNKVRDEMNEKFNNVDARLSRIDLSLDTIITILKTKTGTFDISDINDLK